MELHRGEEDLAKETMLDGIRCEARRDGHHSWGLGFQEMTPWHDLGEATKTEAEGMATLTPGDLVHVPRGISLNDEHHKAHDEAPADLCDGVGRDNRSRDEIW